MNVRTFSAPYRFSNRDREITTSVRFPSVLAVAVGVGVAMGLGVGVNVAALVDGVRSMVRGAIPAVTTMSSSYLLYSSWVMMRWTVPAGTSRMTFPLSSVLPKVGGSCTSTRASTTGANVSSLRIFRIRLTVSGFDSVGLGVSVGVGVFVAANASVGVGVGV